MIYEVSYFILNWKHFVRFLFPFLRILSIFCWLSLFPLLFHFLLPPLSYVLFCSLDIFLIYTFLIFSIFFLHFFFEKLASLFFFAKALFSFHSGNGMPALKTLGTFSLKRKRKWKISRTLVRFVELFSIKNGRRAAAFAPFFCLTYTYLFDVLRNCICRGKKEADERTIRRMRCWPPFNNFYWRFTCFRWRNLSPKAWHF